MKPETKKCDGYKGQWACASQYPDHKKVPITEFGVSTKQPDGLQNKCRKCHSLFNDSMPRHPDNPDLRKMNWITARAVHHYGGNPKDRKNDPRWKECRKRATEDAKAIDWVIPSSAITVSITEHSNVVPFPPVFENSREQVETVTKGRKRDQKVVTHVRKMYDSCSVEGCDYSDFDVAHIHALRHDADDLPSNCLALCPNHHRDLDRGRLQLADPSDRAATDPILFSMYGDEGRIILSEHHEVHNDPIRSCISEIDRFLSNREEQ
ncbi:MAG: hypothetical protein EB165_05855 [Euryarchaeota archaeon]|nr:hypothetical protein [Euryarchaeota archaeon]